MEEPVIADAEMIADLFGDFKGIDFGEAEATAEDYGIEDEESKAAFSLGVPVSEHLEHLACDQMPVYEEVGALPVDDPNHPNLRKYMKSGMNPELLPPPEDEETLPDFANQGCSPPHTLNVLFQEFISHTELCFKKLRNQ